MAVHQDQPIQRPGWHPAVAAETPHKPQPRRLAHPPPNTAGPTGNRKATDRVINGRKPTAIRDTRNRYSSKWGGCDDARVKARPGLASGPRCFPLGCARRFGACRQVNVGRARHPDGRPRSTVNTARPRRETRRFFMADASGANTAEGNLVRARPGTGLGPAR
jgi:hypothetical protein